MSFCIYRLDTGRVIKFTSYQEDIPEHGCIEMAVMMSDGYIREGEFVAIESPGPHMEFDWETKVWVDPRSLADMKAAKWEEIKRARASRESSEIVVSGRRFDADRASVAKIMGAVQLASMSSPGWQIDWTLADNAVATLSASELIAVGVALGARTAQVYAIARGLRAQIDAATSGAALDAITWPAGSL